MTNEQKLTPEQKQKIITSFITFVMYLKAIWYTWNQLIKAEKENSLLTKSAPDFFQMLNTLFIKEFYLVACKLTDPAGKDTKKNLTVSTIVDQFGWTDEQRCTLNNQKEKLDSFRSKIVKARNKIIAHNNLETSIDNELDSLGAFDKGADNEFLETLEKFCNDVHKYVFGTICGQFVPNSSGDVQALIIDLNQVPRPNL